MKRTFDFEVKSQIKQSGEKNYTAYYISINGNKKIVLMKSLGVFLKSNNLKSVSEYKIKGFTESLVFDSFSTWFWIDTVIYKDKFLNSISICNSSEFEKLFNGVPNILYFK